MNIEETPENDHRSRQQRHEHEQADRDARPAQEAGGGEHGPAVLVGDGGVAGAQELDPARAEDFYRYVRKFWPGLPAGALAPDYAGIRPKITGEGEPPADFMIDAPKDHGLTGLVQLFGIESPGLTSALSLGEEVVGYLAS